jgi:hypothetical protein
MGRGPGKGLRRRQHSLLAGRVGFTARGGACHLCLTWCCLLAGRARSVRGSYAERDIGEGVSERSNENARKVSGAAVAHALPCGERASVFCFPGYGQPERKPGSGEAIQACATPPERPVWCLVEGGRGSCSDHIQGERGGLHDPPSQEGTPPTTPPPPREASRPRETITSAGKREALPTFGCPTMKGSAAGPDLCL